MSVDLAIYRPGLDDAEVLDLRARVWGPDHPHTTAAFLAWLFQRNPEGPGSGILLRRKGALIGFAGLSPRAADHDGRRIRVAHGLDFMIDPGASKGLAGGYALKAADAWRCLATEQGYAFGVNFPNANSYRLLTSARLGWRRTLAPRLLVRPLPGLRPAEGMPRWMPPALAALGAEALARVLALRARIGAGSSSRDGEPVWRAKDFGWVAAAEAPGTGLGFSRGREYLAWRYLDHPVYRYGILARVVSGGPASGLVFSPRTLFGVESVLIVDLVGPDRTELAVPLIAHAVAEAAAGGARIVGALACAGTPLDRALRACGFLPVPEALNPKPFFMVARPLAVPDPGIAEGPWRFAWGDMDVV